MNNYPKNSMGSHDARNQRLTAIIYILGFIAVHATNFLSDHHFVSAWRIAITVVATGWLVWLVRMFWKNAYLTEDFAWPEIVMIILAVVSAVPYFFSDSYK